MNRIPSAALFDLDGVLIDSETTYTGIWSRIESAHPTGIENFAQKIKGSTLPQILSKYFPEPEIQADVVRMLNADEQAMPFPIYDGVTDFLKSLRDAGIPAAIVTSSNGIKMTRLYEMHPGFRELFDTIITADDITRSKPDPECYITAAARLGANPADAVVFEDSFNGLRAGRAAGAHVVALSTANPAESLREYADTVIPSFKGLTAQSLKELLSL